VVDELSDEELAVVVRLVLTEDVVVEVVEVEVVEVEVVEVEVVEVMDDVLVVAELDQENIAIAKMVGP
jgi:hypothetical protein